MKITLLLLSLLSILNLSTAQASGGEVGNGIYITYISKLSNFELRYPKAWRRIEFGEAVSFIESGLPSNEANTLNINIQRPEKVKTLADLGEYLEGSHSSTLWEPVILGGKQGFQKIEDSFGMIYLLRSEGAIVSVRYHQRDEAQAKEEIAKILSSLTLR